MPNRKLLKPWRAAGLTLGIIMILSWSASSALGSVLVAQTPIAGRSIPKYVDPLPVFGPAGAIPRVNATAHPNLTVTMEQITQQVLPAGFGATRAWAYRINDTGTSALLGPAHWPAVTVEAQRGSQTTVFYVNNLPSFSDNANSVQGLATVDQTLHWADPMSLGCAMAATPPDCVLTPFDPCCVPYTGPVPAVAHLHGGEVPSAYDGGPDTWFTPGMAYTGPGFVTDTYTYPNTQEPGTLWFHDHALGATRLNVYGGLAAFYFLRGTPGTDEPANLPSGAQEIEIGIQDRMFDTTGQLFFPDIGINPSVHPYWIPEFFGDTIVVNGKTWPFMSVNAQRYRFRILNGSNARFYNLTFDKALVWQIGWDDNYLDAPVAVPSVFIAPGERADIIVDFAAVAGKTFVVTNDAKAPYPGGSPPDPRTVGQIMQFRVGPALAAGTDTSCNPAVAGQCARPNPIVKLANNGAIGTGVTVNKKRQLTLNEVIGAGGPLEILVNNTKWDGLRSANIAAFFAGSNGISELPQVGATEEWEIINLTADTHPIHTHLVQFQLLSRQTFQANKYIKAYNAAFTGTAPSAALPAGCVAGQYCPAYGPPSPYLTANADGAIGGNPAVTPFLQMAPVPASPVEAGWKDTIKMNPGEVTRILVRWAPTDTALNAVTPGTNLFAFDPTSGPGYVWHCHIIDHEDNEMMRPYKVSFTAQ
jgi:spore coat protein A